MPTTGATTGTIATIERARKVFVDRDGEPQLDSAATRRSSPQPIFMNPQAPFINSLVNGTSGISDQVAYATHYVNAGVGVHPSEPNYIWAEAGTNFGVFNDDTPYHADCSPDTVQTTDQHLSAFLTKARTDVEVVSGGHRRGPRHQPPAAEELVDRSAVQPERRVHRRRFNAYNYSTQYNYAAKHNPMVFFTDTNGGCNTTTSNPLRTQYAPLQQLALDLQNDDVADYNWITPNQFNDMHTGLTQRLRRRARTPNKGDRADIAQGDNFLARIVPADHGVGRVQGPRRDRALVGRERRRRHARISRCRSSSSPRMRTRT